VNLLLGVMAVSALVKLLPYNLAQQERLHEIQSEVAKLDGRVDRLQAEFDRNFDPHQTMEVMREQSARINPNQHQIIWKPPSSVDTAHNPSDASDAPHPEQQAFRPNLSNLSNLFRPNWRD
jgi:hypothetical protein